MLTLFWADFWLKVDKWLEQCNSLMMGGNQNMDIHDKIFLKPFEERNRIPVVHLKHGHNLPAMHNAGSLSINKIFVDFTI